MGVLLRRMGIFSCEVDPRWEEEYEHKKQEREEADIRRRRFRFEELHNVLMEFGLTFESAEKLSSEVWEVGYTEWGRNMAKLARRKVKW